MFKYETVLWWVVTCYYKLGTCRGSCYSTPIQKILYSLNLTTWTQVWDFETQSSLACAWSYRRFSWTRPFIGRFKISFFTKTMKKIKMYENKSTWLFQQCLLYFEIISHSLNKFSSLFVINIFSYNRLAH